MVRGSVCFFLLLVFWVGGSLPWAQSTQQFPAKCLVRPSNTGICHSQVNGLLCYKASAPCFKASCIIEGIGLKGAYMYYSGQILPCSGAMKVCGDSEINCTERTCHAVNVSSSIGVCSFKDNAQQEESSTNQNSDVFNLTVTSVIDLASTPNKSPTSAPMGSGGTTPTASPSSQTGSDTITYIILGIVASIIILLITVLSVIGCVIILLKQKRDDNSSLNRLTGHNIYSKLPEEPKHDSRAKSATEPLYSTVTDALVPTHTSPLYDSITVPQASVQYTAIQTPPARQLVEGGVTQPEDSQSLVYSTIVRQQDGKKVTTTIVDPPHQRRDTGVSNTAAVNNRPSADTPEISDTMSADGNPPEDEYYSTVVRRDGEKVTVKMPAPKKRD